MPCHLVRLGVVVERLPLGGLELFPGLTLHQLLCASPAARRTLRVVGSRWWWSGEHLSDIAAEVGERLLPLRLVWERLQYCLPRPRCVSG